MKSLKITQLKGSYFYNTFFEGVGLRQKMLPFLLPFSKSIWFCDMTFLLPEQWLDKHK